MGMLVVKRPNLLKISVKSNYDAREFLSLKITTILLDSVYRRFNLCVHV